jgi:hypothetical protein
MKMLTANFRRYRLYFLCNVFSVSLFYSFAAIFTNKQFMDTTIVDSFISSNICAPSLFVGVFLVLFIPYSYNVFLRIRKYEYGVLITLGMSENEVLTNMLLECFITAAISLFSGLFLGTLISFIFYFIIHQVIGVSGLQWHFNVNSYKVTAILYGVTMLATLITNIYGFMKMKLIDLMKERFRSEKRGRTISGIFLVGMVFVAVSVFIMVKAYGADTESMWFVSLGLMFVGLGMIITYIDSAEKYLVKIIPNYKEKHITELSFAQHHHKSRSRTSLVAAWMIGFSIFLAGLGTVMYPIDIHNAATYAPYDLSYSKIFGKNQVEDSEIENLLKQNGVLVKAVKEMEYLRGKAFNLLSVSQVNEKFNCSYHISEGEFMMLFQYDLKDGYEHEMTYPKTLDFTGGDKKIQLQLIGSDVRILFNKNRTFADKTMIISDADYKEIEAKGRGEYWNGVMKLYSFDNWKDSSKGIAAVQKYLLEKNNLEQSEQRNYRAASRIENYMTGKQSAEFLVFVIFFVVVLFCGASNIIIHFKIKAEAEEEQRMLSSLHRIGVTAEEMLEMIKHKNIYYYMPQVIIGVIIGVFYNYTVNKIYGFGGQAAWYSLFLGMILVALQLFALKRYSRRELLSFHI